jgi:hypothetical protein
LASSGAEGNTTFLWRRPKGEAIGDDGRPHASRDNSIFPKLKDITASIDGPLELCCPITLLLFQDPVKTLHGQTYERAAIEDWLESKSTDPMTGDILKIKV